MVTQTRPPRVDETPAISKSIPLQVGPSGEIVEPIILFGTSFQVDLEERLRIMKEIQFKGIPEGAEFTPIPPVTTLTEPIISQVRTPTPNKTNL